METSTRHNGGLKSLLTWNISFTCTKLFWHAYAYWARPGCCYDERCLLRLQNLFPYTAYRKSDRSLRISNDMFTPNLNSDLPGLLYRRLLILVGQVTWLVFTHQGILLANVSREYSCLNSYMYYNLPRHPNQEKQAKK